MNEQSILENHTDLHIVSSESYIECSGEIDCRVDESSSELSECIASSTETVAAQTDSNTETIQNHIDDIPMEDLLKEIERRSKENKAAEEKVVDITSSSRWREHFKHRDFQREYKVVFHGDEYSVLKQRVKLVTMQRARILQARADRKMGLNLKEIDVYTSARYRRNMTRASQRESTKAMVHWFGRISHSKIVEEHLQSYLDDATNENKVIYTSSWSKSFHGLQEAYGY